MTFEEWWNSCAWEEGADVSDHVHKAVAKAAWDAAMSEYSDRIKNFIEFIA